MGRKIQNISEGKPELFLISTLSLRTNPFFGNRQTRVPVFMLYGWIITVIKMTSPETKDIEWLLFSEEP